MPSADQKQSKPLAKRREVDYYKVVGIPMLVLFFIFSILIMQAITNIRLKELKKNLQQVGDEDKIGRSLPLVSRYLLIKKRMLKQQDSAENYLAEGQLMAIMSGEFATKFDDKDGNLLEAPALFIVNNLNKLLALPPVGNLEEDKGNKLMEIAYFYERKREFSTAIKVYNAAIKFYHNAPLKKSYNLLHRGFCLSLIGKYDQALQDYTQVILMDKQGEMSTTAQFLANFLKSIRGRLLQIDNMKNSIVKGAAYYHAMAYRKSIKTLNKLEKKSPNQQLYFYRGRSYEEIGYTKKAVHDYKRVINMNAGSKLAKNANRRLYILGTFYTPSKKLRATSRKIALVQRDRTFFKKSKKIETVIDKKNIKSLKKDKTLIKALKYINKETDANFVIPKKIVAPKKIIPVETKKTNQSPKEIKKKPKKLPKKIIRRVYRRKRIVRKKKPIKKTIPKRKDPQPTYKEFKTIRTINSKIITRIKQLTIDPLTTRDQKKQAFRKLRLVDKLYTKDGSVFTGIVIKNANGIIKMATVYGIIRIPAADLIRRTQAKGSAAVR